jgi:cullin 1
MVGGNLYQPFWDTHTRLDLSRMYSLLLRIPNGLEPLRKKFEEHVRRSGLAAVQKVIPTPGADADAGKQDLLV